MRAGIPLIPGANSAGGGLSILNEYEYSTSDTYTKNDDAKLIEVICFGGGAGGCSGTNGNTVSSSIGGNGGWVQRFLFNASDVSATETITVGAGGAGGVGNAQVGSAGGDSSFGNKLTARGAGAPTAANANPSTMNGTFFTLPNGVHGEVQNPGIGKSGAGTSAEQGVPFLIAGGGGGGGPVNNTLAGNGGGIATWMFLNSYFNDNDILHSQTYEGYPQGGLVTADGGAGPNGGDGSPGSGIPGAGGGGGTRNGNHAGGTGGYPSGGGGAGGTGNGTNGNGGPGGGGCVFVREWG